MSKQQSDLSVTKVWTDRQTYSCIKALNNSEMNLNLSVTVRGETAIV